MSNRSLKAVSIGEKFQNGDHFVELPHPTDDEMVEAAGYLKVNTSIQTLEFHLDKCTVRGITVMCDAVASNKSLRSLRVLESNSAKIQNDFIAKIAETISVNTTLEHFICYGTPGHVY
jgi:hypothetical protein